MIVENFIKVFTDPGHSTKDQSLPSNSKVINS